MSGYTVVKQQRIGIRPRPMIRVDGTGELLDLRGAAHRLDALTALLRRVPHALICPDAIGATACGVCKACVLDADIHDALATQRGEPAPCPYHGPDEACSACTDINSIEHDEPEPCEIPEECQRGSHAYNGDGACESCGAGLPDEDEPAPYWCPGCNKTGDADWWSTHSCNETAPEQREES